MAGGEASMAVRQVSVVGWQGGVIQHALPYGIISGIWTVILIETGVHVFSHVRRSENANARSVFYMQGS